MKGNCHTGNIRVIEEQGVTVYGGGTNRDGGWHTMAEVPDLALGPKGVMRSVHYRDVIPDGWKCANAFIAKQVPILIEIDWPDFSIPSNLGKVFWVALVEDIKERGIKTVSCQCMGGHGRTGVQLAILMHYLTPKDKRTWKDAADLVMEVRKRMCEHCVESKSQQTYIAEVCDLPEGESVIVSRGFDSAWDDIEVSDEDIIKALEKPEPKKKKGKSPKEHFSRVDDSEPIQKGWKAMLNLRDDDTIWAPESEEFDADKWTRVDGDIGLFGDQFCAVFGVGDFHPLEMHDAQTSKFAMAKFAQMEVDEDNGRVKVKGRWYHPAFLEFDEESQEVMLASDLWKEAVKEHRKEKEMKE